MGNVDMSAGSFAALPIFFSGDAVEYKTATLVFPVRAGKMILLGLKKTGLGKGFFNGFGGKVEPGETIREGALRELAEETGIDIEALKAPLLTYAAKIRFKWPDRPQNNMVVHVFFYSVLHGGFEAVDTEEMTPTWFRYQDIPYGNMWPDDSVWLRGLLNMTGGAQCVGNFEYDADGRLFEYETHVGRRLLRQADVNSVPIPAEPEAS